MAFFGLSKKRSSEKERVSITRDAQAVRFEEAALNSTAVPEQMLYEGWLIRWAPGRFKRMRSVNVLSAALRPLDQRLAFARRLFARKQLPLVFRITSLGPDLELDAQLASRGFELGSPTYVMACPLATIAARYTALRFERVSNNDFAETIGALRADAASDIEAHRRRLNSSVMEAIALIAWTPEGDCAGGALAIVDDTVVGIFDVVVNVTHRRLGYAQALMAQLAARAGAVGATIAYLQVEHDNDAARALYLRMGFTDAYNYWYRIPPQAGVSSTDQKT
jgi:ribosomal protein S18 acetylase RimI-like enzyme